MYTHLEETYRVLNGAYQIITGTQTDTTTASSQPPVPKSVAPTVPAISVAHAAPTAPASHPTTAHHAATNAPVAPASLLAPSSAVGHHAPIAAPFVEDHEKYLKPPRSRPSSRQKMSRPSSRRSIKRGEDGNEEEEWGEEEEGDWEWEYYYDEEENGEREGNDQTPVVPKDEPQNDPVKK